MNKVRRNRRQRKNPSETRLSDSSSSTTSTFSSLLESSAKNLSNANNFPKILPQSSIPLELGVINTRPSRLIDDQDQDVHQLIEMCRRWREISRKSREANSLESQSKQ